MNFRLFQHGPVWWPTRLGWACLLLPPLVIVLGWCSYGESYLSPTSRLPGDVLVVEGWAGRDGMPAAVREFQRAGCRLLVSAGGPTSDGWAVQNWNYAELTAEELLRHGLPKDQLLVAPAKESEDRYVTRLERSWSAESVWRATWRRWVFSVIAEGMRPWIGTSLI